MRKSFIAFVVLLGLASASTPANAVGCLTGGAAGALGGHMLGHGVLGAIGGCIAGHTWKKHKMRKQDLESRSNYDNRRRSYDQNYRSPYNN